MKFSTETLNQVAELLLADWEDQGLGVSEMTATEIEYALQEGLQDVGRLLLAGIWEAQDERLHEAGVTCQHAECQGKPMRRIARREVKVTSLWGPVSYRRGEYACEQGHRRAALDEQQGLHPGQPTPRLEMLLGASGAVMPFEQGADWVQNWLQVQVSPNTVRRATCTLGTRQEAEEQTWYEQSADQESHRQRQETASSPPRRVYASIDGGFVPLKKGQNGDEDWREAKMVTWYQEGKPYGDQKRRAKAVKIYGTLQDKQGFGELFWGSGYHYGADLAEEVVVVSDGAVWIWDLVQTYFPKAVQIVDWTHAAEYLHAIRKAWEAQDEASGEKWLTENLERLWEGQVQEVIAHCRELAAQKGTTAAAANTAAGYLERHARRMDYKLFREKGYFIGSGTIESGVKRVIGARMKVAGARWNQSSGELVLKARCAFLNSTWHSLPLAA